MSGRRNNPMVSMLTISLLGAIFAGCGVPDPHATPGVPTTAPDDQYFHDAQSHVDRVIVWNCVGTERILLTNQCGMICGKQWMVHRMPCGTTDGDYDSIPVADRKPMPAGTGW